jgi:hypothetical protein
MYVYIYTVEYLISKGANVNDKTNNGMIFDMCMCIWKPKYHARIMEFLVSKGASINDEDNGGGSCLMCV